MSSALDLAWLDPSLGALQRRERGIATGLSKAIADRLGVDVVLVRVAFVVLALCSGLGAALYGWGTLLSVGPDGRRPVDASLPGFATWSPLGQKVFVLITTVVLMAVTAAFTPLPWGAGALMVLAFVITRRSRQQRTTQQPGSWAPLAVPGEMESDDMLIERWRQDVRRAAGSPNPQPLPVVDLYSEPEPEPTVALAPRPRTSWLAGLLILAATIAAAAIARAVAGLTPLTSLAVALAVLGVLLVGYSVMAQRRTPRIVLVLTALAMAVTGWLAVQVATPAPIAADSTVKVIHVVDQQHRIVLTEADLTGVKVITVRAVAADVTVLLPGVPAEVITNDSPGAVSYGSRESATSLPITVDVEAIASSVDLDVAR